MQKIYNKNGFHFNPYVFFGSAGFILLFLFLGAVWPEEMGATFKAVQDFLATTFGWFYIASVGFFLFFVIWLLFSPYGEIRLGKNEDRPEFSTFSWFSMLFSAGMGIGLIFFSVAEPIMHFTSPPIGEGGTIVAAKEAMRITFFHWGLHAWAIYIVLGLALSYFHYRKGLPLSLRSAVYPILGDKIHGTWGNLIDIFAVLGTMFGIATSLGLGVAQVNAGLHHLGWMEVSQSNQFLLIIAITLVATVSVVSGVGKGILWLSKINIWLGTALLIFVFVAGPTLFLLQAFIENTGGYLQNLITATFWNAAYVETDWLKDWTIFYWAWWISWAPFVGMFIARISKGRTIREFVIGVLFVPTALTFLWLTIFGNTALYMELFGNGGIAAAVKTSVPSALYVMLAQLPLWQITSFVGTLVVAFYFITSSDSGSLVIDILTSGGHKDPPVKQRVFWALTEGGVAAVLLYAGGLSALRSAAITTALPLTVILLVICYGLVKSLRAEGKE